MSRYTLEFNEGLEKALTDLATSKGITKADVLRRAIASYAYLNKEMNKSDHKVSITDQADKIVKDVVLP
jgi:hypothetical protein